MYIFKVGEQMTLYVYDNQKETDKNRLWTWRRRWVDDLEK